MRNLILVILTIFMVNIGNAQSSKLPELRASFLAIITSNIDSSTNWYTSKLGFELVNRVDNVERGFKQANLTRGDILLELIELKVAIDRNEVLKENPRARISGYFKFGFTVKEFDVWANYLKEAGVEFNGRVVQDQTSGKKMLIIKDPDGNRIQFFEE